MIRLHIGNLATSRPTMEIRLLKLAILIEFSPGFGPRRSRWQTRPTNTLNVRTQHLTPRFPLNFQPLRV